MDAKYILTNPWFYSDVIALLIMFGLIILLTVKTRNSPTIRWFKVYLLGTIAMSLVMDMGPLFANSLHKYDFRSALPALSISILIIGLLHFTFHFIGKPYITRKWWFIVLLYGGCALGMLQAWYFRAPITPEFYATVVQKPWGYYAPSENLFKQLPILPIASIGIFLPIFLVLFESIRSKNPVFKRQARLVALGISLSLVTAMVNALLLAIFDSFPPIPIYGNVLLGITITYALLKYGSSAVDPDAIVNSIVGIMGNAAVALDNQNHIIFANSAASKMLHVDTNHLYGQSIEQFLPKEKWEEFSHNVLANAADSSSNLYKTSIVNAKGERTAVNVYSSKYTEKDGHVFGTILVLANVQRLQNALQEAEYLSKALAEAKESVEQKVIERTTELHEEQAKLRASIQSLSAGFMILDTHDMVVLRNNATSTILGMDPTKTYGVEDLRKIIARTPRFIKQLDDAYTNRMPTEIKEIQVGEKILSIYFAPMFNDEDGEKTYLGGVVLIEDITERKIAERSKDEFFSIASHELRTPLAAIEGNSSMMMTFYNDSIDESAQHMISDIHESSLRLISIVNDFLDVSRLEQGKVTYDYEEVALDEIIEHVIYETKTLLRVKNLTIGFDKLTLGELPKVWADKNRLKQIIYNMTGNAIKFTTEGGIKIGANVIGDKIKISVTDTGPGIPEELQSLLFHKFQQANESILTRDTTQGTGLGLYISKMMIEAMGGRIYLEKSEVGHGTTFSFEVPIAGKQNLIPSATRIDFKTGLTVKETTPSDAKPNTHKTPDVDVQKNAAEIFKYVSTGNKMKLLIVEDDPYVLRMYESLFSIANFDVKSAVNGKMGIETAISFKPDIILMDIMMPVMNGLIALERLKLMDETKDIPVIMLTNFGEEETAVKSKAKGAESYLIKSDFTPENLLLKVRNILDKSSEVKAKKTEVKPASDHDKDQD